MKHYILAIILLISFNINAQHTISGTFSPAKDYTWLIAYRLKPGTQVYVADTKINDGKFTLELPKNAKTGTYRLVYAVPQEEFNFDILYNGTENIVLNFNKQDGVTFSKSKDNELLTGYFLEINALKQQVIDFYTSSSTSNSELANLYEKLKSTQTKYKNSSKGLLSNQFITANKPYIAKQHEPVYDYIENKKETYFTSLNFNNETLQASSFLTDKALNYIFTSLPLNKITKSATENILQQNIQKIALQLNNVSDNYKFHLFYEIWLYAASAKYDKTSDFVYINYLKKLGNITNNQELIKGIEVHTRLRYGAKAPEITWNNNKNCLSDLEAKENYVLIFWSSSCSHCLKELPKLHTKLKENKAVTVLAVGLEDGRENWGRESAKLSGFTNAIALGKWDSKYAEIYNISSTPTYFVLDKDKRIVAKPESYKDVLTYLSEKE